MQGLLAAVPVTVNSLSRGVGPVILLATPVRDDRQGVFLGSPGLDLGRSRRAKPCQERARAEMLPLTPVPWGQRMPVSPQPAASGARLRRERLQRAIRPVAVEPPGVASADQLLVEATPMRQDDVGEGAAEAAGRPRERAHARPGSYSPSVQSPRHHPSGKPGGVSYRAMPRCALMQRVMHAVFLRTEDLVMNGCWRVLGAGLMAALLGMSVGGVLAAPAVSTIEIPVIQCDNPPVGDPQVCTPLFRPE